MSALEDYREAMLEVSDRDGLPMHCPFPVTADGQGPASGDDFHHWICWCAEQEGCPKMFDLAWAALAEVLRTPAARDLAS